MLEEQRERTSAAGIVTAWMFHRSGRRIVSFHRSWRTACAAAGVPGRIPHDFRRTAVRNLERAGVPQAAAMAMVGHQTASIYRRYAISDTAMLQEAGEKLASFHAGEDKTPTRKVVEITR